MGKQKTKTPAMPQVRESDWVQTRELVVWEVDTEMKRLLPLLLLALLAVPVMATNLNFQQGSDNSSIAAFTYTVGGASTKTLQWVETTNARNNYINTSWGGGTNQGPHFIGFVAPSASASTYAAATLIGDSGNPSWRGAWIVLFDGSGTAIGTMDTLYTPSHTLGRYEVKISGGTPYYYRDGSLVYTGDVLAQNPSYIAFGTKNYYATGAGTNSWDDYVYGQNENPYVFGLPESSSYIILDDIVNDAADGVYNLTTSTQVDANYMHGTWARGNVSGIPPAALENESVNLVNYLSGAVYATNYTGTAYYGTVAIPIKTNLIDAGAPDGWYALTIPGTGAYSNMILKRSNGATVAWDKDTYRTGDTGTVISVIADGGYWDPGTYTYKLGVMDIYGIFHGDNTTISAQTSTVTHDWSEDDDPGVYYAILFATTADNHQYMFGLDWADLENTFSLQGYVNDAQTGSVISGSNLNFTQGATIVNTTSGFDGNYTAGGFATGAALVVNATATNYNQYVYSFTPAAAKTVNMNVSLVPLSPTLSGLGIGGVARDVIYGRPIQGVTVVVTNTTTAEWYTKATSTTGWYLCDEGESCFLQTATPYSVWGNKTGYHNSTVYSAVTV